MQERMRWERNQGHGRVVSGVWRWERPFFKLLGENWIEECGSARDWLARRDTWLDSRHLMR